MWLPMWVFDGNGFTMACLAVWIRNVAQRWGSSAMAGRSGAAYGTASNGSSQFCRISVATSGTDFISPQADFAALLLCAGFFSWDPLLHCGGAGVVTAPC